MGTEKSRNKTLQDKKLKNHFHIITKTAGFKNFKNHKSHFGRKKYSQNLEKFLKKFIYHVKYRRIFRSQNSLHSDSKW